MKSPIKGTNSNFYIPFSLNFRSFNIRNRMRIQPSNFPLTPIPLRINNIHTNIPRFRPKHHNQPQNINSLIPHSIRRQIKMNIL